MKTGVMAIVLAAVAIPVAVNATTLHLSTDIDLLVLDGKKVSSSLLRGAERIELDNGPHQLVFRVEKNLPQAASGQQLYISPPLVVSFNTQTISQVNFSLPPLDSEKEGEQFDLKPELQLLDGSSTPLPIVVDLLEITQNRSRINYEAETRRYNKAGKPASLPQFAGLMADDSALLSGVSELDPPVSQSQTLTEQRLKYWFSQADKDTRSRFLKWAKDDPS